MAFFVGTNKEFRRYIGPRLRNLVQQQTKAYKAKAAVCQHCGSTGLLESAHVKGRDRNQIVDQILAGHYSGKVVTVNLDFFEEKFKGAHNPIEQSILILCHSCHVKYDSTTTTSTLKISASKMDRNHQDSYCGNDALPVKFELSNAAAIRSELLNSRTPEIPKEGKKMDGNTLVRKLISVGKQVFVEHSALFHKLAKGKLTKDECIERLVSLNVSNENGAAIRCGNAKQIFQSNAENDALLAVINSTRLSQTVIEHSQQILRERAR